MEKLQSSPLVSVIIVNFNGKKWLDKCLYSLRHQTYHNLEVLLIDNDSSDASPEYVKKKHPYVRVFTKKNEGYGAACNLGAQKARGKFLMFFNEDMYVESGFVGRFMEYFFGLTDPDKVGTIGCRIDNYDKTRYYSFDHFGYSVDFLGQPAPNNQSNSIFYNSGCPFFIAKDTFIKVKGFCPNIFLYSEDIDLCWRLNLFGYRHYFIKNLAIYHKGGGVIGGFSPKKIAYYFTGDINTILNNYSALTLLIVLPLFFVYYSFILLYFVLTFQSEYIKSLSGAVSVILKHKLKPMLEFRTFVQKNRVISDYQIIFRISMIPSRFKNIYFKNYAK
jgi:hypothetical protein